MKDMEYREWLKQLKPGDNVVVSYWNWSEGSYTNAKVEKITPTRFIRVKGILYKPHDGNSRSGNSDLLDPNDETTIKLLKKYKENKFVRETMNKIRNMNYNDVTYEQAVEIRKIMGLK